MKKKNYLIAFFAPWLMMLFSAALGTCGHDVSARTYTDSICMFMLTWLLLRQFTQERQQIIRMTATMLLTMVYFYNRKATEATLIIIILAFINLAGYDMWSILT